MTSHEWSQAAHAACEETERAATALSEKITCINVYGWHEESEEFYSYDDLREMFEKWLEAHERWRSIIDHHPV